MSNLPRWCSNIADSTRNRILGIAEKVTNGEQEWPPHDMFDDASQCVYELMSSDTLPRFIKSEAYEQMELERIEKEEHKKKRRHHHQHQQPVHVQNGGGGSRRKSFGSTVGSIKMSVFEKVCIFGLWLLCSG